MWTTDGTHDCQGCKECKTTYAGHPDYHRPLQPHVWGKLYNQNTGKPYKVCEKCHTIDDESYKKSQIPKKQRNAKTTKKEIKI